ncbi:hypothetical protein LINGRAHAP2_LOCUS8767 [Linum grandiflorum]
MGGSLRSDDSSSSDEEDAEWKAAIHSVASTTTYAGSSLSNGSSKSHRENGAADEQPRDSKKLKLYQIKAQRLLDELLEKSLDFVEDHVKVPDVEPVENEGGGVRLFKNSKVGISFDKVEIQRPTKKPRLVPELTIEEDSKKFRKAVKSIAVDGSEVIAAANDVARRALARMEAKEARAKEKAKKEEERVAELKKTRGEKWLPSIAKEMQLNKNPKR